MVGLYMFLHCINLDYPNLTCQLRPCQAVKYDFTADLTGT